MTLWRIGLLAAGLALLWPLRADADVRVEVVGTDPEGYVTLARDETYYVRIRYQTDEPIRIWARPFFGGAEVSAKSNPSATYEGTGEAIGWCALLEPGQVDEIRVSVGGGSPYQERQVATYSMGAACCASGRSTRRARPAWVDRLTREADIASARDAERVRNAPPTRADRVFDTVFPPLFLGVLALGLFGLVWPVWGVWRWRGGWRAVAALPALFSIAVFGGIVVGTAIEPTSHNLWPFEILVSGAIGVAAMFLLTVARFVTRRAGRV